MSENINYFYKTISCLLVFSLLLVDVARANYQARISTIPTAIKQQMQRYTWRRGCPLNLNKLAYVTVSYWGFDHRTHSGVLIVNWRIAKQITQIFKRIYQAHFPIYRIAPMYQLKGNERLALQENITSGFNCRHRTSNKNLYSIHSYGLAIDINPMQNPFQHGHLVLPPHGQLNRNQNEPGMIKPGDSVYKAFTRYGWRWGGNWRNAKDYMHFQKTS